MFASGSILWTLIAGIITLAILSFLYRDNPFYKAAEHVAVGVSIGFMILIQYNNVFRPKVLGYIFHDGKLDYIIPAVLGVLLFSRFVPRYGWLSRWSLAFLLGATSGVSVPQVLEGRVMAQMEGSVRPLLVSSGGHFQPLASLVALFLFAGTIACLVFFLFSVEHKGALGKFAYFGRLCIMAGFGASFGYTVMGRVSLLIGRMLFLTRDFAAAVGKLFS